ncbi:UNVERIFIED_CONTAM: hypothetical protein DV031_05330 [Lacticaseibacillus paracasei]|uniref:Uncharacterized protein n=1 Tax=Lacticaseibacillus paracasei TaxID=1597 RepID=A0ABD6W4G4_LACPA|nr:hypothetical protein [Lacticaseibacillus paracasei]PTV41057.1 hypothetical protein DB344_03850 [Lactobacillus sp. DS13_6]OUC71049.1 hypothetical protein BWK52_1717c [Lacticaseibacillus paracasei]OUC73247.1 hypothetical protein B4Q23_1515c [Lacticaseibacillus paracasei]POE44360.1 hypothetical protein ACX51_00610 [Lacticaseibacillus paracasei]
MIAVNDLNILLTHSLSQVVLLDDVKLNQKAGFFLGLFGYYQIQTLLFSLRHTAKRRLFKKKELG